MLLYSMILNEKEYEELERLLSTNSPSSAEDEVSSYIRSFCQGVCSYRQDSIGNSFLSLSYGGQNPVMIAAHSDEIGLQVVTITNDGFIRFRTVGGVDLKATAGRQVFILSKNGKVPGVICKVPVHVEFKEKIEKQLESGDLWIDIGCKDIEGASSLVSVGDMISFAPGTVRLGASKLSAKALDNKLGVYIAAAAIKRLAQSDNANDVTAVLTVQEEVGCKGAVVATEALKPSYGICIDVGVATDCPGVAEEKYGPLSLGKGPALVYCTDTNRRLTDNAARILQERGIPFQKTTGLYASGGTDAARMQIAGCGVPCISISIPLRSMHTPSEVCDLEDVACAVDAIVAIVEEIVVDNNQIV